MKKWISIITTCLLLAAVIIVATGVLNRNAEYTVKSTPAMEGAKQLDNIDLRFYKDSPHVPYYGMKSYLSLLRQEELTVTSEKDGSAIITAPNGATLQVDTKAGTITATDWALFQNPLMPYTSLTGVKDTPCQWTYYSDIVFDDAPKTVVFDFGKYGIRVYADKDDVYLPIGILSTMFTDIAMNYAFYNGETFYRSMLDLDSLGGLPAGYFESENMRALLSGERKRDEDEIRESYGELCFIIDYFYGFPGRAAFDENIREKGLDETLKKDHEEIRNALLSDDMRDFYCGLNTLMVEGLKDGGHTLFSGGYSLTYENSPYPELRDMLRDTFRTESNLALSMAQSELDVSIIMARDKAWGSDTYRECGNTAIITFDDFMPYVDEWEAYYAGSGEIPDDPLGRTLTGLKKASENPKITNILFDITANSGGSNDVLSAILDLTTGDNEFHGTNVLTGQHQHVVLHTDKNFDGVIDDKDDEVKYDFNYAVLTTREAFSCGNLFPFLMQENGAVLLGEPTGGGSCAVQVAALSNGVTFQMSSHMWTLGNKKGENVEAGCNTDIPIKRIEPATPSFSDPHYSSGDYTPFFDEVMLDKLINDWFAANE